MKVFQVLNHFLPQQTAGTEVYSWALSKELQRKGIEVKVLVPNYGKSIDEEYAYDGLTVHKYAEPSNVDRSLILGFREAEGIRSFTAYLKKEKPDVVHFHELAGSNGIGLPHVRAAKRLGAKVVMTFHLAGYTCVSDTLIYKGKTACDGKINTLKCSACYLHKKGLKNSSNLLAGVSSVLNRFHIDTTKLNHPIGTAFGTAYILNRLEQKFFELIDYCDQVVSITKWYQQVLQLNGVNKNKVTFIEQGLPTGFSENEEPHFRNDQPLKLMFLGRISPLKGLHLLIEALESFTQSDVELSIFGSSDGSDYAASLLKKTKNKTNIHWNGKLEQSKVLEVMRQHDLLCLCSTFSEMSPLVIQEARAAGLPVLASNVYGNAEQISHGENGLLYTFEDIDSLREQIMKVIQNKPILSKFKENIDKPRSFELVANDYIMLYQNILKK